MDRRGSSGDTGGRRWVVRSSRLQLLLPLLLPVTVVVEALLR